MHGVKTGICPCHFLCFQFQHFFIYYVYVYIGKSADETEDQSIDNRKDIENKPPKNDQIAAQ